MLNVFVLVVDVLAAIILILTILLHSGKGGGLSDMFGGGGNLSGGTAIERRLDKITVISAVIFGLTTFYLSWKWDGF